MFYKQLLLIFMFTASLCYGQKDYSITSMDFVEVVDANEEEAWFYYENNWKVLRQMALKKGYIQSFKLLKDMSKGKNNFSIVLMTSYKDSLQFQKREEHFQELIKQRGVLSLLNEKQPAEFRKTVFSKDFTNQ